MRARAGIGVAVVAALILSGCSAAEPVDDESSWTGLVGQGQVSASVGDAIVIFPAGVAPAGTGAKVVRKPATAPDEGLVALSDTIDISLEGGLQPAQPVSIVLPVQLPASLSTKEVTDMWLFVASKRSDGQEDYASGTYDPAAKAYTVNVKHFSDFKVLGIDVGAALDEVRTSIMQGLGLEYPAPDCVGKSATVNDVKYEAVSPPGAHLCLSASNGTLVVEAYPAVAMPYLLTPKPKVDGTTAATETSLSTASLIAFARALRLIGTHSTTGVFPGAKATYRFTGQPAAVSLKLEQYPVLLLMVILAKTLDTLGLATIDKLEDLQCLSDVASTNTAVNKGINGESVGAFARSFFSCAGTLSDLSPLGRFLIAAIGTAPALLVTAIVGIINEFTGLATQRVDLTVTSLRPTSSYLLNSELSAHVCWTGKVGWDHATPIQLKDGQGTAFAPDGSFGGASVIGTKVVGWADLDGDGRQEVVLALECAGSPPEQCCAGRQSTATTVVAFAVNGRKLTKAAPSLMGGQSGPGDKYGPADREISSAKLSGSTVVTKEYIVYPEGYTAQQVGGDPYATVTVKYTLRNGAWAASRP